MDRRVWQAFREEMGDLVRMAGWFVVRAPIVLIWVLWPTFFFLGQPKVPVWAFVLCLFNILTGFVFLTYLDIRNWVSRQDQKKATRESLKKYREEMGIKGPGPTWPEW